MERKGTQRISDPRSEQLPECFESGGEWRWRSMSRRSRAAVLEEVSGTKQHHLFGRSDEQGSSKRSVVPRQSSSGRRDTRSAGLGGCHSRVSPSTASMTSGQRPGRTNCRRRVSGISGLALVRSAGTSTASTTYPAIPVSTPDYYRSRRS